MKTINKTGKYLTRITPNENNWQKPSGCNGKCSGSGKDPLYESLVGFGWEEWLFDTRNRIGEYQYGFLECFNKQIFNIEVNYEEAYLYTRKCISNTNVGKTYLVVKISNLKKLSKIEAEAKEAHFNNEIKIMQSEIPNTKNSNLRPSKYFFNVKFKIEDVCFVLEETEIKVYNYRFNMIKLDIENKNHVSILKEIKNCSFQ